MNNGKYTLNKLLNEDFRNYTVFLSRYYLIEDREEFRELLFDIKRFHILINKIILMTSNYVEESLEINNIIFDYLYYLKNDKKIEIKEKHLYSLLDLNNLIFYNEIKKDEKIKTIINVYINNKKLFELIKVSLISTYQLFLDKSNECIDFKKIIIEDKFNKF
tara:strand:+ start:433 stop:918 length:486 start_codon:yes stop_codon:yes gene_type:complete